jgi:hypothetical protein
VTLRPALILAVYGMVLLVTGFFHSGEMKVLQDIRGRALALKRGAPQPEPPVVEAAGEIVDSGLERPVGSAGDLAGRSPKR